MLHINSPKLPSTTNISQSLLQQATSSGNLGAFSGIQQMAGMSALQLQNLATLAAAAAAAQNSASPSTANPLSSNAASLGALASPGNAAASQVGGSDAGGRGGGPPTPAYVSPLSTVAITKCCRPPTATTPKIPPPPHVIPALHRQPSTIVASHDRHHLHCSDHSPCC
ncbi:hypothetical protein INR49_018470 [Caranx melampygus]|nr:hypothetical protein INR49_018470 [Caranx melampygus]